MRSLWLRSIALLSLSGLPAAAADPVELPPVEITVATPPAVVIPPNPLPPGATSVSISAKVPAELPPATACGPCTQFLPAPCDVCERRPRTWAELGFIAWVLPDAGVSLPGADSLDSNVAVGVRATAGYWLDARQCRGVEFGGFVLEQVSDTFAGTIAPPPPPGVGRPIPGLAIPLPATIAGRTEAQLWGLDGSLLFNHWDSYPCRFDSMLGLRYADLSESLTMTTRAGQTSSVENINARTQFCGPQIGGRVTCDRGRFGVSSTLKIGLGISHETLSAWSLPQSAGTPVPPAAGLLVNTAQPGQYTRDYFAVLPEWGFRINYRMTEMTYASVGYDLLYFSEALRPGEQIQRDFQSDYFAHGLTLALGLKY